MSDESSESHRLFVSYASDDAARVEQITAALANVGVPVWVDRDGIVGGASYATEIAAAIRHAPAFLLCLTPAALNSRNVRQEVALAWKHERPIIPLLLEPTEIPPDLEYWLEATQWIELLQQPVATWLPSLAKALAGFGIFGESIDSIPTRTASRLLARSNLPLLPPAVIGRDKEITEIAELLRSGTRLLTLTGPGGVGKTTLAVATAQTLAEHFPDGIFFVDLAPVRSIDHAISTAAQVLGIRELRSETAAQDLAEHLLGTRVLLIFDNTEHLDGIGRSIEALLTGARETTALVTSRRPLHVRGERELSIQTLPVAQSSSNLADIGTSPSVQFFLSRAAQSAPGLLLGEANAPTIVAICERLDGLLLALELAAARLRLFSPVQLLARLEKGLAVLGGDSAKGAGRQRTLGDAAAWSVNLLAPSEQALFRRLAVFVGGCTLTAAEAVVVRPTTAFDKDLDLLGGLDALVDNSLVIRRETVDGEIRFGMLATMHDIAHQMLDESDEVVEIRNRHADWCNLYSAEIGLLERDFTTLQEMRSVADDFPNFRAAFSWLAQTGDDTRYKWMASNLNVPWGVFDGREFESILLKAPKRDETADLRLHAHFLQALLAYPAQWLPQDEAAHHEKLNELQSMWEQLEDRYGLAHTHYLHSLVYADRDDWPAAHRELDLAIATWQEIDQRDWIAFAFVRKCAFAFYAGDVKGAEEWNAKALTFYDQTNATVEVDFALQWKAIINVANATIAEGCELLLATLQDFRGAGSNSHLAGWAGVACGFLLLHGDTFGRRLIDEAIRIQHAMGVNFEYFMPNPRRIKVTVDGDWNAGEQGSEVLTLIQILDVLESRLRALAQPSPKNSGVMPGAS